MLALVERTETDNLSGFIGQIRNRLMLIYLLPSIVLLLLSLVLIRQQYREYRHSARLVESVDRFEYGMQLIDALQKERGLSVVSIEGAQGVFAKKLVRQRRRTDECFAAYRQLKTAGVNEAVSLGRLLRMQRIHLQELRSSCDRRTMGG